jgi:hypothetical protein
VFESSVDGLFWAVGRAGWVELGQHVGGPLLQCPAERDDLGKRGRDAVADRVDQVLHKLSASGPVGLTVDGDYPLVDAPARLDLGVGVGREQRRQPVLLSVGE